MIGPHNMWRQPARQHRHHAARYLASSKRWSRSANAQGVPKAWISRASAATRSTCRRDADVRKHVSQMSWPRTASPPSMDQAYNSRTRRPATTDLGFTRDRAL